MIGKQDDWVYKNTSKFNYEQPSETCQRDKGDYHNLNIATFTFGGRQNQHLNDNNTDNNQMLNTFKKNNNPMKKTKDLIAADEGGLITYSTSGIINKIGQHNSFLSVVVHALWHMKVFRNYVLNDVNINLSDKDPKNKLLYYLKNTFTKYSQGGRIDITVLRNNLAECFQNRRKFLIEQPDDPVDCYYAFINSLHSYFIVIFIFNF
jgi:hypothetical protein